MSIIKFPRTPLQKLGDDIKALQEVIDNYNGPIAHPDIVAARILLSTSSVRWMQMSIFALLPNGRGG